MPLSDILLCLFWGGCLSGLVNWTFIIASRHLATAELTLPMLIEFALGHGDEGLSSSERFPVVVHVTAETLAATANGNIRSGLKSHKHPGRSRHL